MMTEILNSAMICRSNVEWSGFKHWLLSLARTLSFCYLLVKMATPKKILLAGDSFVKRLERFHGQNLSVPRGQVHMIGMSGKGVGDIHLRLANLPPNYYSVVVLCVGGNDLCRFHRTPAAVVHDLFVLAEELVSNGTSRVIICQLLHRASTSHFEGGLCLAEYNSRVNQANFLLQQNCIGPAVKYWRHHPSVLGSNRLHADGVHLNTPGMLRFRRSLLSAIRLHMP